MLWSGAPADAAPAGRLSGAPLNAVPLAASPLTAVPLTGVALPTGSVPGPPVAGAVAPAHTGRDGATLTVLADGRVLAVGGDTTTAGADGAADVFDPVLRAWTPTTRSPDERRRGSAAARLPDGTVLVVGGTRPAPAGSPAPVARTTRYDPATDSWLPAAQPAPRPDVPVLLPEPGGTVLLVGGGNRTAERYAPATGTWTTVGDLPWSRSPSAVLLPGGDVLAADGERVVRARPGGPSRVLGVGDHQDNITTRSRLVTTADGRVLVTPSAQGERAVQVDGPVLCRACGATRLYDPVRDVWRTAGDDLRPASGSSGAAAPVLLPDGRLLRAEGSADRPSVRLVQQDPATDLWREAGVLARPRGAATSAALADGSVLVLGGTGAPDPGGELVVPPPAAEGAAAPSPAGAPLRHLTGAVAPAGPDSVVVQGHLAEVDGTPVAGRRVQVWRRPTDRLDWSLRTELTTDDGGLVSHREAPPAAGAVYTLRAPSQDGYAPAGSPDSASQTDASGVSSPDAVVLEAAATQVRVAWLPAPWLPDDRVDGYEVLLRDRGTQERRTVQLGSAARETVFSDLPVDHDWDAHVRALTHRPDGTPTYADTGSAEPVRTEQGRRLGSDVPTGAAVLCGRLPAGTTRLSAAQGPVHLCRAGVVVGLGSALVLDSADGPLAVLGHGGGGIRLDGGDLRTSGPAPLPAPGVVLDAADDAQQWGGVWARAPKPLGPPASRVALHGLLLQHARRGLVATSATGVDLSDVTLRDLTGPGVEVLGTGATRLRRLEVRGATSGVHTDCLYDPACIVQVVDTRVSDTPAPGLLVEHGAPVLQHVTVARTGLDGTGPAVPAVRLSDVLLETGPGRAVDDLRGGGNALDAVLLSQATVVSDLTWPAPRTGSADLPVPLGFVNGGLTMGPGTTLSVASGTALVTQVLPFAPRLTLRDARLDVQPGAVLTAASDPSAPLALCSSSLAGRCSPRPADWGGVLALGHSDVRLTGATVRYALTAVDNGTFMDPAGPATVQLVDTEVGPGGAGVRLLSIGGAARLAVQGGSMHDLTGDALDLERTAVHVSGLHVADAGQLRVVGSRPQDVDETGVRYTAEPDDVVLEGLLLERTAGVVLQDAVHPRLRSSVFRATSARRAVSLVRSAVSIGPGKDLDGLTASGAADAVGLSGVLTSDLTWATPTGAAGDHPLGYELAGRLTALGGATVVLPRDARVSADPHAQLVLLDARLDGTAGGAVLAVDPPAPVGCPDRCADPWGGVLARTSVAYLPAGPVRYRAGSVDLVGATVRGAGVALDAVRHQQLDGSPELGGPARLSLVDTTLDGDVTTSAADSTRVTSTRARRIDVAGVHPVAIEHVVVSDQVAVAAARYGDRQVEGRPRIDLALHDVVVTAPRGSAAVVVDGLTTTVGQGAQVDGLRGGGPGARLRLAHVDLDQGLTWTGSSDEQGLHPLATTAVAVLVRGDVRVPAGATVPVDLLTVEGGALDASAGGAVLGPPRPDACAGTAACSPFGPGHITVSVQPGAGGRTGGVALSGAEVRGTVFASGPVRVAGSRVEGLSLGGGTATVTDSELHRLATLGAAVDVLRSSVTADPDPFADWSGISVHGGRLGLDHVEVRALPDVYYRGGAVTAEAGADIVVSCSDISADSGGVSLEGAGQVTISDSDLTGSTKAAGGVQRRDLNVTRGRATTSRVWWGQPSGPRAEQAQDRTLLTDVSPAVGPVACASRTGPAGASTPPVVEVSPVVTPTRSPSGSVAFSGSVPGLPDAPLTYRCSLDGAAPAACTSPYSWSRLVDGGHTLSVVAVRAGGATSTPVTRQWRVDTRAPSVTATTRPPAVTTARVATVAFTATDTGGIPAPARSTCRLDGGAAAPCTSPVRYSGLRVGSHTVTVQVPDAAGNTGSVGVAWRVRPLDSGNDMDGDGRADLAVWRPSTTTFAVRGTPDVRYGLPGDVPVLADYDGDGRTDLAVWRPSNGTWYVRGGTAQVWGAKGDVPVPGDFDGDGRADLAVWRPSLGTFLVRGMPDVRYGTPGDVPVAADYNGDGRTDLAVWRPSNGTWYIRGGATQGWGVRGDVPLQSDVDGDGRADLAVWRPSNSTFYVRGVVTARYGTSGDVPVPADLTGDGRSDLAVWRPSNGTWYVQGASAVPWGVRGDVPLQGRPRL